jgi:hypothetical protein
MQGLSKTTINSAGKINDSKLDDSQVLDSPSKKNRNDSSKISVNVDAYGEYIE